MERAVNPVERADYRVLVVDGAPAVRQVLAELLSPICRTALASTQQEAEVLLERQQIDAVLVDGQVAPDVDYRELITMARGREPRLPVVVLSRGDSSKRDRQGISFLSKRLIGSESGRLRLVVHVDRLVRDWYNNRESSYRQYRQKRSAHEGSNFVIGLSQASAKLREEITRAGQNDLNVLLTGDTGVGKTLVAECIHQVWTGQHSRPLVVVEPAALPPTLFESELFGHARGAFTGATSAQPGAFEAAHHGIILLDEIGDLPFELQVKLLRAVERKVIRRIGDNRDIHLNFRVIAASNRDLERDVSEGRFRADLFQRLNEMRLHIPPLRRRQDDIIPLFEHFLAQYASSRKEPCEIDLDVADYLRSYHWPGNVREIRTLARRLAQPGLPARLTLDLLVPLFPTRRERLGDDSQAVDARIRDFSRQLYMEALALNQFCIRDTARSLEMPYGTLRSRLKSLDLIGIIGKKKDRLNRKNDGRDSQPARSISSTRITPPPRAWAKNS